MNPFNDQARFMTACDQLTGKFDGQQAKMYFGLIVEEFKELCEQCTVENAHTLTELSPAGVFANVSIPPPSAESRTAETADALLDIIVVCIGMLHSMGLPAERLWAEVVRSNMAKVSATGKVTRRVDGKILKPDGWTPPDLAGVIRLAKQKV